MLLTFTATLSTMLVMLTCIIIGFVLKTKKMMPDNCDAVVSKLENFVFVPAVILNTFMTHCTVASVKAHLDIIIYSVIATAIALLMANPLSALFERADYYRRNIYRYALTFANSGFMGNALVIAILQPSDSEVFYKYLLFTLPMSFVTYTWGVTILTPKEKRGGSLLKNLMNPTIIAVSVGMLIGLSGMGSRLPGFILTAIDYLQACMVPSAMLLTGFVVGSYPVLELLSDKKIYAATILRLFILPAVLMLLLRLLGASDLVLTLALFGYATPLGLNTVVFPAAYGGETHTGAAMAVISHLASVLSIPVMYAALTAIL